MPKKTLDNKIETVYICMNCSKLFDKKPDFCIGKDKKVHSYFTDKESPWYIWSKKEKANVRKGDISEYIFGFDIKFHDSSEKAFHFAGSYPHVNLKEAGFPQFYCINDDKSGIKKDDLAKQFINNLNKGGKPYIFYTTAGYPGFFHYDFHSRKKDIPHFKRLSKNFDNYLLALDKKRIKIFEGRINNVVNSLGWGSSPTSILEIDHNIVKRIITFCPYRINIGEKIEAYTKKEKLSKEMRHPFKFIVYNENNIKQFEYLNGSIESSFTVGFETPSEEDFNFIK